MDTEGQEKLRNRGALWGGLISGMASGLTADMMAGGLSLGGGMIVGGVLGALGGAGVAQGYGYLSDNDQSLQLSEEALTSALKTLLAFILCASAHGRARGIFTHNSWSNVTPSHDDEEMSSGSRDRISDEPDSMTLIVERCQYVIRDLEERFLVQLDKHKIRCREISSYDSESRQALSTLLIEVIKHGLRTL
jgi:hypothetical protein